MVRVHWQEDRTTSIVDTDILQLEILMSKKQNLIESPLACPLQDSTDDEDADGDHSIDLSASS